jgi:hypothetical protein
MRFVQLLSLVMVGTFAFAAQPQTPAVNPPAVDDSYSVSVVSSALQYLQQQNHAEFSSFADKNYLWPMLPLGDRVSIAILRIYTADELVRPENAGAYLTVTRNAFSMRSSVKEKSDTDPRVTLFVLEYLQEKETSDPAIVQRITYIRRCVKDFTCSSQGEYEFMHKSR